MVSKKHSCVLQTIVILSLILSACAPVATATPPQAVVKVVTQEVVKTVEVEGPQKVVVITPTPEPVQPQPTVPAGPKVLHLNFGLGEVSTLDPSLSTDVQSIQVVEETFVGLTRVSDQNDVQILPGMATQWDISADGKTYTFHLRSDVPWVKWDAAKQSVEKVQGCDGKDRMVTARDFEYGILRTLDPKTASDYAYVLSSTLEGAAEYNSGKQTDVASVGVKALDDATLELKFKAKAAFNVNIAGMWVAFAEPKWQIDGDDCTSGHSSRWIEQGFFQSYGPYTLKSWIHDDSLTIIKNPYWPGSEGISQPKIDEVTWSMVDDAAAFASFEAGSLDVATVPLGDMDRVKNDPTMSKMFTAMPRLSTFAYNFNTRAKYVDDVRVRRALSLAIDRQGIIDNVAKANQEAAHWFCRPGLVACPTVEKYPDLGVKYDPEKAKASLDEYLKENNLTADQLDITLMYYTTAEEKKYAEAIADMWLKTLGIRVNIINQEFKVYLKTWLDPKATAQIFDMGWGQDYPDANNFTREVYAPGGFNNPTKGGGVNWQNDQFEKLVLQAAEEQDAAKRMDLYAQAEQILVYDDCVMIPIYWRTLPVTTQPYVLRTYSRASMQRFENWDIQK